jgi:hypothetical protein
MTQKYTNTGRTETIEYTYPVFPNSGKSFIYTRIFRITFTFCGITLLLPPPHNPIKVILEYFSSMNDWIDRRNMELNVSPTTARSNIHHIWANDIYSASQENSWQLVHIWMSNNSMLYLKPCKRSERYNLVASTGICYTASIFKFPFTDREMYLLVQTIRNCFVLKYMMCKI